jgi:hypothetical protein
MDKNIQSGHVLLSLLSRHTAEARRFLAYAQERIAYYSDIREFGDVQARHHVSIKDDLFTLISELTGVSQEGLALMSVSANSSKEGLDEGLNTLARTTDELRRRLVEIAERLDKESKSAAAKVSKMGGKGRKMNGFGEWLNESKLGLTEIITLRERTRALDGWGGIKKYDKIGEYIAELQKLPSTDQVTTISAFYALWPLYDEQEHRKTSLVSPTGVVVAVIAILLLGVSGYVVANLGTLNFNGDNSQGILAFLFGLTTVGIVIIVVVAVFFEARETTLDDRFQRGKDILTILIGLLGAILGYYFGQQAGQAQKPPITAEQPQKPGSQSDNMTTPNATSPPKGK